MAAPISHPINDSRWKIPGYTGYTQGLAETIGSTPVKAQHKAAAPTQGDFLHTRQFVAPAPTPSRDSCNFPETYKPCDGQANLWPTLQTIGELTETRCSE